MNIPEDLYASLSAGLSERGNTALHNFETGDVAFYHEVEVGGWLEIVAIHSNYPAWTVQLVVKSSAEIKRHIEENYSDPWIMTKNNINANVYENMSPIPRTEALAQVETDLYSSDYPVANMSTESNIRHAINAILKKYNWQISGNEKMAMVKEYYDTL